MRFGEIADVDIVANAGAVRRVVIVAVNRHAVAGTDGSLGGDFDQMCRRAYLTGATVCITPGDIEIAQRCVAKITCNCGIAEHPFGHQLAAPVRADRCG